MLEPGRGGDGGDGDFFVAYFARPSSSRESDACWLGQEERIDCRLCADAFGPEEGPSLCREYFCGM